MGNTTVQRDGDNTGFHIEQHVELWEYSLISLSKRSTSEFLAHLISFTKTETKKSEKTRPPIQRTEITDL